MDREQAERIAAEALKYKRPGRPKDLIDQKFPEQAAFVKDESRYLAAVCTRRAGKTTALGFRLFRAAMKYPKSLCAYIALTRDSAKDLMWPVLEEINDRFCMGAEMTESSLTCKLSNGARIRLFGADMKNFIRRLRGKKYPFVAVDEAQSFGSHLSELVDDILIPSIADYVDGAIALTGTPGPMPHGLFYDATEKDQGYSVHKWSIYQNPYMPDPKGFIEDLKRRRKWTDTNPTFLREWQGKWVKDLDALVYKYNDQINGVDALPTLKGELNYILGIDLGYSPDPTAFVLGCYTKHSRKLFILQSFKKLEMTVAQVARQVEWFLGKYERIRVVMDAGGGGKQVAESVTEEIRKRYSVPVFAAEKEDKAGFIQIMNSDLQAGDIQVVRSGNRELIAEWEVLPWDTEAATKREDGGYPNHCADGALYLWRHAYNYAWQPEPKPKPAPSSEAAADEFWERESRNGRRNKAKPFWMK